MQKNTITYPLISIFIPVYNRVNLIGPCIESALAQTYSNFEIIIVDNSSTDGTWDKCCIYAKSDSRIRIFKNDTNIGPVRNWQRCIEEAKGEFGKILFSDDLIYPAFLEKTISLIEDPQVGLVFTTAQIGRGIASVKLVNKNAYPWQESSGKYNSQNFIRDVLLSKMNLVSPGAALFRISDLYKNLITQIPSPSFNGFADYGAGPNLLLYLLTAIVYPKIAFINEPLCFFRGHEDSFTEKYHKELASRYFQAKIWFALNYQSSVPLETLLFRGWCSACKKSKKYLSFKKFCTKYGVNQVPLPNAVLHSLWN
ncbi:glycosyl transferase family protein [Thioploca ingrica]|uniref:Glycosyl transferase family protein n=1 Tax=Thioploca ingrica TaxID=40754 RepID=A0A090ADM9_9GAMM|nr:glycosyl transferase family protein [Thioploca ingrica]